MILFYLLISVMPLTRHPFWAGFFGDFTMIKYLGFICFAYALAYFPARHGPLRLLDTAQSRWFTLFVALASVSFVTMGPSFPLETSPMMAYLSFALLFATTVIVVDTTERLRRVLLASIGSAAFASLYVLREWQKLGFTNSRPGWVTGDPNYFTVSALLFLPLAFCLLGELRGVTRIFCLACLGTTALAVVAAASRGGFFGLVAASLFLSLRVGRQRLRAPAFAVLLLLLLASLSPASPLERLLNPRGSETQAMDARLSLWEAGLNAILAHPVTGIGAGNFKFVIADYSLADDFLPMVAHNTYVETAAELGVPGLLIFLAALGSTFIGLNRVRRRVAMTSSFLNQATLGLQAGLVAYAVSAFFVSVPWQKFLWLVVFLSMAIEQVAARHPANDAA